MTRVPSDETWTRWTDLVNLGPAELEQWLDTPESWAVGSKVYGAESVGHRAGRRIVDLIGRPRDELDPDDWRLVRKAVGVIRRHRAQRPEGDVTDTRWRHALMNWGHDPLRD